MEVLSNIVFFKTLKFNYGKTVLSEEHLKTLSSSGNYSGHSMDRLKIQSYIEKGLFLLASVILLKCVFGLYAKDIF